MIEKGSAFLVWYSPYALCGDNLLPCITHAGTIIAVLETLAGGL